jgi:DNA-binding MarR family transcriptional regulator
MTKIKLQEYDLLNEIAQDSMVTQSNLAERLGIAVGSVNWYIKRLINRGYVKVSHLDRTRLKYDLTAEGMKVFTQRATQYAKDSLKIYNEWRRKAKQLVRALQSQNISRVHLHDENELMDILRLTCIEGGITLDHGPEDVVLTISGQEYSIIRKGEND